MAIPVTTLELRAGSYGRLRRASNFYAAKAARQQTAFLCHSHRDAMLAKGLQVYLNEKGWDVYIDWEDTAMPEEPNRTTATNIQERIKRCDWFLFLATQNSTASRWCPWEIGYADGEKALDSILIVPTSDRAGRWHGNEYLQLYRKIDITTTDNLAAFHPNQTRGTLLRSMPVPAL